MADPYEWTDERGDRRRRYDEPSSRRDEPEGIEGEAARLGHELKRGWQRVSEGVRRSFEAERGPYDHDPRRAGGMFGGEDRRGSLFSHDDGLGGRRLGAHRGKGPQGYVRSDERILEEVSDRLMDDGLLDASDIEVKVEAGELTLNGHVARREDKRRAEDLAEQVSGVKHLQNNLRVRRQDPVAAETPTVAGHSGAAIGSETPVPAPPLERPRP